MDRVAMLTSGGDAPGMNDAIRGVVRTAIYEDLDVIGFRRGYEGLIENEHLVMDSKSVSSILEEGGTILRTYRSPRFRETDGQQTAADVLESLDVDGLVVIGGNGSFRGLIELSEQWDGQVVGIPATIDNDISGTDLCLGHKTAVDTALDALDHIRDTATSHERTFILEVMGRYSGHIALSVGLAGGAEEILIPEQDYSTDKIADRIKQAKEKGKLHYIIVLAEGAGRGFSLADELEEKSDMQTRVVVLGHVQRGGAPSATDRIAGGKMGYHAVHSLLDGESRVSIGIKDGDRHLAPLSDVIQGREINDQDLEIARTLTI